MDWSEPKIRTKTEPGTEEEMKVKEVMDAIREAEKENEKTTAMFHYQVLIHAGDLLGVDPVEFCREVGMSYGFRAEFRKMINLAALMREQGAKIVVHEARGKPTLPPSRSVSEAFFQGYTIRELETRSIEVEHDDEKITPVMPVLRELAKQLNIGLVNSNGNPLNTRQLGTRLIKCVHKQIKT